MNVIKSVPRRIIFQRAAFKEGRSQDYLDTVYNGGDYKPSEAFVKQVLNRMNKAVNGENAPALDKSTVDYFIEGLGND